MFFKIFYVKEDDVLGTRSLMAALGLTVATAVMCKGRSHVLAGALLTLLCARHVWKHRRAL